MKDTFNLRNKNSTSGGRALISINTQECIDRFIIQKACLQSVEEVCLPHIGHVILS